MINKGYFLYCGPLMAVVILSLIVLGCRNESASHQEGENESSFCAKEGDLCAAFSPNCDNGVLYSGVVIKSVSWENVTNNGVPVENLYQCSYLCQITGDCLGLSPEVLVVAQVNKNKPKIKEVSDTSILEQ